jgi:hypothetical protein
MARSIQVLVPYAFGLEEDMLNADRLTSRVGTPPARARTRAGSQPALTTRTRGRMHALAGRRRESWRATYVHAIKSSDAKPSSREREREPPDR